MKTDFTSLAPYGAPLCEWTCLTQAEMLCQSPENGAVEEVDYEDWTR